MGEEQGTGNSGVYLVLMSLSLFFKIYLFILYL